MQGQQPGWGPQQGQYGYAPQGYGPPPKKKMTTGEIVLIVIGCVLSGSCALAMIATIAAKPDKSAASPTEKPASSPVIAPAVTPPQQAAISVTATQLFSDYQANEVAADDKYKDTNLRVSGTVHSIDKDATDSIVIRLSTPNEFMSVAAEVDDSQKAAAKALKKGQNLVVACKGGGMVIGSPQLRNCKIQ